MSNSRSNSRSKYNNKIYVTGKVLETNVETIIQVLEKMGYVIFLNCHNIEWTTLKTNKNYIDMVVKFISDADLLIVDMITDEYKNENNIELGIGLGLKKDIWIISDKHSADILSHKFSIIHFKSWNEVFSELETHGTI